MTTKRSICTSEPSFAIAGDFSVWKFTYISSVALPKGSKIKFDMLTNGRAFDWQIPQTKGKGNLIFAEMPGKVEVKAKPIDKIGQFEFVLPSNLKAGEKFVIVIGTLEKEQKKYGNLSQRFTQRKKPFYLYVDPAGKGEYVEEPEIFYIDVKGGKLENIKIIVPSVVARNRRFDVIVRFEDHFGNLTNLAPEGTLIELSYEHLRETLNWKLFVPETGFLTLPNLYFNEPGTYRIKLKNLKTGELFLSSPIKCFAENDLSLFWGILHGEAERFDSTANIESVLRYFRDEKVLHFFASSPMENLDDMTADAWKNITYQINEFNENDRFTAFLGFQWLGEEKEEGLRDFVFSKDNKPILRRKDAKSNNLKKISKTFQPKDLLAIPTFTTGEKTTFDFKNFSPEFERVVEIYNCWGSSECTNKEGNLRPLQRISKKEETVGCLRKALNDGHRFGFVAGGLDGRGVYKELLENCPPYSEGLTAILSVEHSREALFEALYNRSCYATTGERILLWFTIAEKNMGSELSTLSKPGLEYNRYISGFVLGTAPLKEVTIFRNGEVFKNFVIKEGDSLEFDFDDQDLLSDISLQAENRNPFVYYYIRAVQKDGHIAWGSPIWIDFVGSVGAKKKSEKAKGLKRFFS